MVAFFDEPGHHATHRLHFRAMPTRPDDPLDLLLRALADGTRRALLDRLRDQPGLTLTALLEGFPQTRQALSKHLR